MQLIYINLFAPSEPFFFLSEAVVCCCCCNKNFYCNNNNGKGSLKERIKKSAQPLRCNLF